MSSELQAVVRELETHAAGFGWDQPERLYAVVSTAELLANQPDLADALADATAWTPVEQEPLPPGVRLEEMLAQIIWPEEVDGCAVVLERLVLPPEADAEMPTDPAAAQEYAAGHPGRQEVRIVAAVLRGGEQACALRLRSHDEPESVLTSPDLVPDLLTMLHATLEPLPAPIDDEHSEDEPRHE